MIHAERTPVNTMPNLTLPKNEARLELRAGGSLGEGQER